MFFKFEKQRKRDERRQGSLVYWFIPQMLTTIRAECRESLELRIPSGVPICVARIKVLAILPAAFQGVY